jgi:hypothetical protein
LTFIVPVGQAAATPTDFDFYEQFALPSLSRRPMPFNEMAAPIGPHVQQVNRLEAWYDPFALPTPRRPLPFNEIAGPVGPHVQQVNRLEGWYAEFSQPELARRRIDEGEIVSGRFEPPLSFGWYVAFDMPPQRKAKIEHEIAPPPRFDPGLSFGWFVGFDQPRRTRRDQEGEIAQPFFFEVRAPDFGWFVPFSEAERPAPRPLFDSISDVPREVVAALTPSDLGFYVEFWPVPVRLQTFNHYGETWLEPMQPFVVRQVIKTNTNPASVFTRDNTPKGLREKSQPRFTRSNVPRGKR